MAVVYDVKTGEAVECQSVDAKEMIASGAYRKDEKEPAKRGPKPKAEKQKAEEVEE